MAHVPIPKGSLGITSPPESLPDGWTMHTHPEGKPYYHRDAREPEPELLLGVSTFAYLLPHPLTPDNRQTFMERAGSSAKSLQL
jgi:hypothetical protein